MDANNATQDILHSLELEEHDYRDLARLSKELREVRQIRRKAKDTMSVISPVLDWVDSNGLSSRVWSVCWVRYARRKKNTENRIYTPRKKR